MQQITTNGITFLVDDDIYEELKDKKFTLVRGSYYHYVRIGSQLLHRLITQCPADKVIDHINGNVFDNRAENLRITTRTENNRNHKLSRRNTTGENGVIAHHGRFMVRIWGRYVGFYETIAQAVSARDAAMIAIRLEEAEAMAKAA